MNLSVALNMRTVPGIQSCVDHTGDGNICICVVVRVKKQLGFELWPNIMLVLESQTKWGAKKDSYMNI